MIVVIIMLAAVFAGCAGTTTTTTASQGTTTAGTTAGTTTAGTTANIAGKTVSLITSERTYEGQGDAWKAAAKAWGDENGATMNINFQGSWAALIQTLQAAKISGEVYDLASIGSGNLHQSVAPSGLVLDITEIVKPLADRFVDGAVNQHTIGGHVFGLPFGGVSTTGLFYNKTMFTELGLTIENGYTYEDLVAICKVIKDKKNITPIIQQGASWWWWPAWFFFTYAQETGNNSITELESILNGDKSFVNDQVIAAFDDIGQFFKDGLLDSASLQTDNDGMAATFMQQKCAMFFGSAGEYKKVMDADFDIGFVSYPVVAEGATPQSSGGADEGINVLSLYDPENLDAIASVLEYFTRADINAGIQQQANTFGYAIKGVDGAKTEVSDAAFDIYTDNTIMYLDWFWSAAHNDAMVAAIQGVVGGEMTGQQAAEYMKTAFDSTVSEGYSYEWWNAWTADDWAKVTPEYVPVITVK